MEQKGFIQLDYLDTEKFRHIDYGNLVLRKERHNFMARGVAISASIFIGVFVLYLSYGFIKELLKTNEEDDAPVARQITSINDLQPPPPMDQNQPPPPPPAAVKPPQAPDVGEVKKVKDEEAPPNKTVKTQEDLKKMIEKGVTTGDDTTGLADAKPITMGGGGSGPVEVKESDGDPPDFVAVEQEPKFINQIRPVYPEIARKAGMEGRVVLKVLIDKDGKPVKATIMKNPGTDVFDEAAIASVMQSSYSPGIQNGRPVKVWMVIPIAFKLNSK
jgi:protein TonB